MLVLWNEAVRRLEVVDGGCRLAMAVVVRARGSTPQKTGAAMLVTPGGETLGTLGGGCVEAETRKRALELLASSRPQGVTLLPFKLDHDYGWDDGVACGGMMDITVEILEAGSKASLERCRGFRDGLMGRTAMSYEVTAEGQSFKVPLEPTPRLVIAGAGHVGQSLARMANLAGFEVTVIDDRPDMASIERFPGAKCVVGPIESELRKLQIDPFTYVVIVTRGHRNDAQALGAVIGSNSRYVGLIGSKRKIRTILDGLYREGTPVDALLKVHAPIGLNIGAVSPEEIAISVCAELIAVRRGVGPKGSLKMGQEELETYLHRENLGRKE